MHPLKAKRIRAIVEAIRVDYPTVARELESIVSNATHPPHVRPPVPVQAALQDALRAVQDAVGNTVALAGGMAVIHWIDLRSSFDIDFVVAGSDLQKIQAAFPGGKLLDLIYTVQIDGADVDFLVPRQATPWTEEAIRNAQIETVMGINGVRVLTPEYLILYKFDAARSKDMDDIKGLLTLPGISAKAKALVQRFMPHELEDFNALALESEYGL